MSRKKNRTHLEKFLGKLWRSFKYAVLITLTGLSIMSNLEKIVSIITPLLPPPEIIISIVMLIMLCLVFYSQIMLGKDMKDGFNRVITNLKGGAKGNPFNPLNNNSNNEDIEKGEEVKTSGAGAFTGMIIGGALGLIGGPAGVIIGGIIGGIIGNIVEYEQEKERLKRKKEMESY
jgi:hypothetical protein